MTDALHLRPATQQDLAFLREVYADTRRDELALTEWDEAACDAFVSMQFEAQSRHYHSRFPDASLAVVEQHGKAVGRLWVHQSPQAIHVLDISLVSAHRGQGVGGLCLQQLLDRALALRLPVRLQVEQTNPARRLYERLGFVATEAQGLYLSMEWRANASSDPKTRPQMMEICDEQA